MRFDQMTRRGFITLLAARRRCRSLLAHGSQRCRRPISRSAELGNLIS
jgi:hypothetical protein